jgi:toxin-antitoxin system PIN domain toxin
VAITADANILINAANRQSPRQVPSRGFLEQAVAGDEPFYLFYPVLVAYLRATTMAGVFRPPLSPQAALENVLVITHAPSVVVAGEREGFWDLFAGFIAENDVRGRVVHDAHIALLMRQHDVSTIVTYDRDFRRFEGIRVIEPAT